MNARVRNLLAVTFSGVLAFAVLLAWATPVAAQSRECEVIDFEGFNHAEAITSLSLFGGSFTMTVEAFRNAPAGAVNATAYDTELWDDVGNPPPNPSHDDTQLNILCNEASNGGLGNCDGVVAMIPDVDFFNDGDDTSGGTITFTSAGEPFEIPNYDAVDSDNFDRRIILRVAIDGQPGLVDVGEATEFGDGSVITVVTDDHQTTLAEFEFLGSGGIDNIEVCRSTTLFCGDNLVNLPGETCDPPGSTPDPANYPNSPCRADCTYCGDGNVDPGETCDPLNDPDCRDDCTFCGDGNVDPGETCDPLNDPDCRDDCTFCGDGNVDPGETCDPLNDPDCRDDCTFCGDGNVDPGETCDPLNDPDCRDDCTFCGDGNVDPGETCDPLNDPDCRDDCTFCGDGNVDPGETCDPLNDPDCRDDCTFCGDGIQDPGEDCDDGNNDPGDGCSPDCLFCDGMIGDYIWNDGIVDEDCDGVQPADGSMGLNGVTVHLLDGDTGEIIQTMTTRVGPDNKDGYYKFSDLCAGNYEVVVETPGGFVPAPSMVGDPATDSNGSPADVTLATDDTSDLTIDFGYCTEAGDEGCTPGYWKVPQHHDSWIPTGYTTGQLVGSVFDEANAYPQGSATLVGALNFGGGPGVEGAVRILLRAAVAALLNTSHPDINYAMPESALINKVNKALESGERAKILDLASELDFDNNAGCPLN